MAYVRVRGSVSLSLRSALGASVPAQSVPLAGPPSRIAIAVPQNPTDPGSYIAEDGGTIVCRFDGRVDRAGTGKAISYLATTKCTAPLDWQRTSVSLEVAGTDWSPTPDRCGDEELGPSHDCPIEGYTDVSGIEDCGSPAGCSGKVEWSITHQMKLYPGLTWLAYDDSACSKVYTNDPLLTCTWSGSFNI